MRLLEPLSSSQLRTVTDSLKESMIKKFGVEPTVDLLCRYLCGITTPYLTKIKARSLGDFGRFEAYAYADIKRELMKL